MGIFTKAFSKFYREFQKSTQRNSYYRWKYSRWSKLLDFVSEFAPKNILEIGVGSGECALRLIERSKESHSGEDIIYWGIDLFEENNTCENSSWFTQILTEFSPPSREEVEETLLSTGVQIDLYKGDANGILEGSLEDYEQIDFCLIDCGPNKNLLSSIVPDVCKMCSDHGAVAFEAYNDSRIKSVVKQQEYEDIKIFDPFFDRLSMAVIFPT